MWTEPLRLRKPLLDLGGFRRWQVSLEDCHPHVAPCRAGVYWKRQTLPVLRLPSGADSHRAVDAANSSLPGNECLSTIVFKKGWHDSRRIPSAWSRAWQRQRDCYPYHVSGRPSAEG